VIKAIEGSRHDWSGSTYATTSMPLVAGRAAREVHERNLLRQGHRLQQGPPPPHGGSMHLFSREHHLGGGGPGVYWAFFIGEGFGGSRAAFTSRYKARGLGDASSDFRHRRPSSVTAPATTVRFFECLNMAALWKRHSLRGLETTSGRSHGHERATM